METDPETEYDEDAHKSERLERMISARNYLDGCAESAPHDKLYNDILKQISNYIHENCPHNFVLDYVDKDCDNGGEYITYCNICGIGPSPSPSPSPSPRPIPKINANIFGRSVGNGH